MRFEIQGVHQDAELDAFHAAWTRYTEHENEVLSGEKRELSPAQKFVIDLYCGRDEDYRQPNGLPYDLDPVVRSLWPGQIEVEAILRGRNRALAEALRGKLG